MPPRPLVRVARPGHAAPGKGRLLPSGYPEMPLTFSMVCVVSESMRRRVSPIFTPQFLFSPCGSPSPLQFSPLRTTTVSRTEADRPRAYDELLNNDWVAEEIGLLKRVENRRRWGSLMFTHRAGQTSPRLVCSRLRVHLGMYARRPRGMTQASVVGMMRIRKCRRPRTDAPSDRSAGIGATRHRQRLRLTVR
jgi:hypothetical protein